MKIAVSFPGCHRRGGIERCVLEAVNFLAALGHEVHLLTSDWDRDALHSAVHVHAVPLPKRGSVLRLLAFARRSKKALAALPPGTVHAAFGVESPPGGVMWVPSVHKAWLEASKTQRDWRGRLRQKLNPHHPALLRLERGRFGGRSPHNLIALTDQVKSDLVRLYGVPAEDIAVLPNGYSQTEFNTRRTQQERAQRRTELGYGPDAKVVIFVANELERKGFGPLLRGIRELQDPSVFLLAVGRLNPQTYAAEIEQLGLTSRVHFTGPSSDVASYYAAADVFALPTQYEAWGLVIVEALACGLPVLTSRLAGAAAVVQEGVTGFLLDDPNDPAEIAVKLRPLLAGLPVSAEDIEASVSAYSWPNILRRYEQHLMEQSDQTASSAMPSQNTPLRVVLLTDADVFAGTERHMLDLARGLTALGVSVKLACPSPAALEDAARREGLPILTIAKRGLVDWDAARLLARRLKAGETDIVHAHNGRTALAAALGVRLAGRGRCVMTQHFLTPNHATQRGPKAVLSGAAHYWMVGQMSRILAISEAVREAMLARHEAPDSKITVIPNGITAPNPGNAAEMRRSLGVGANTPLVVCAARLEREKDVASLISAVKIVRERVPGVRCLVAGEGAERSALDAQIGALGLENSVTLLGFRADAPALMAAADVFVLPSLAEPFGLVLLEAMALSRPVVATRAGGPLEIVVDGETGFLVPPSSPDALAGALQTLLGDPALARRMGENGQARYEAQFTAAKMSQAILAVYQAVR